MITVNIGFVLIFNAGQHHPTPLVYLADIEPSGPLVWTSIPNWYLATLHDHARTPASQEFLEAAAETG